jgi:hypothetical protein
LPSSYNERKKLLLVDSGKISDWRTDIFGNDYALYKQVTPTSIEGLMVWYKSSYGTLSSSRNGNESTAFGGNVIRWLDKSGNGNHLDSFSGVLSSNFSFKTNAPTLCSNIINGKPALYFDGTDSLYSFFNLVDLDGLTVYVVGSFLDVGTTFSSRNYQPMLSISLSSENRRFNTQYFDNESFVLFQKNGKNAFGVGSPNIESFAPAYSGTPIVFDKSRDLRSDLEDADQNFKLFEFVFDRPNATSTINKEYYLGTDDINKQLNNPLNSVSQINTTDGLWVGSYGGGQFPTKCYISEIIIFNKALTLRDRLDIQNYLVSEYDILSLDDIQ